MEPRNRASMWMVAAAVAAAMMLIGATRAAAVPPPPDPDPPAAIALCLSCHGRPGLTAERDGQQRVMTAVEWPAFARSAHRSETCTECHPAQSALPHAPLAMQFRVEGIDACEGCHQEAVAGYLEGPHGTMAELRDATGPTCSECHGDVHALQPVSGWTDEDRTEVCAGCHRGAGNSLLNAISHEPPSPRSFPFAFFAGRFLVLLASASLAFGIIHVELDLLRWLARRLQEMRAGREQWAAK
ncbi:MAG: hypothetical protein HY873_14055 [Chloroflexi bacterium]|nr:hypothetical protein [Chloroflexota bacterium]